MKLYKRKLNAIAPPNTLFNLGKKITQFSQSKQIWYWALFISIQSQLSHTWDNFRFDVNKIAWFFSLLLYKNVFLTLSLFYIYIYVCVCVCVCVYIHFYLEYPVKYTCVYINIYIHINFRKLYVRNANIKISIYFISIHIWVYWIYVPYI